MTPRKLILTAFGTATLSLVPGRALAQFPKAFDTDREFISANGPAELTEHYAIDAILSAPAVVDRLVSVGSRTLPTGERGLHVIVWSKQHTILDELLLTDHQIGGDLVGYDVKIAANKHLLIAGEYRRPGGVQGTFVCRLDLVARSVVWYVGLTGQYTTPGIPWSLAQPAYALVELPNGDVAIARTLDFGGFTPTVGLVSCLDAAGIPKWSKYYSDAVGLNRWLNIQDLTVAPPGSVNPPAGSLIAVGSFDDKGLVMNIDAATGNILWGVGSTVFSGVTQWRGIDFDWTTFDMFLSGIIVHQLDFCFGPKLVVGRLTPGTCGFPPASNWLTTEPGLDFIPAPGAVSFRKSISGSTERLLVAGGTTCYSLAYGMVLDPATGAPIRTWTDGGGGPTTYARTHDLAGSRHSFTAHTIGQRGQAGSPPVGAYVSAANCVADVPVVPDGLPIDCYADDTIGAFPDDFFYPLMWNDYPSMSVEVHNCRNNHFGGGVNDLPDPKIKFKWPP
ncbi:MAG: hypothetical protein DYG93_03030 [Leptolyngbya sp. PLA2]|nr:hypothetical protein [Leptolyngbya sp.]MCE7970630.1 hypothetical protein [Leptolyngbya sp. PL-A2]MCQ3939784.1 hypothetical protein [cyanobacterium CYA1]MCZ7633351.1 hypothetical protein [Phycisphaerales bacterium]MDL1903471.1 hypothetical protein [Synechococcales cyanobacterium CNB]GIK18171.1 MAG: hypothetical protein BroJett004_03350 [Planctomycetota bacterium]